MTAPIGRGCDPTPMVAEGPSRRSPFRRVVAGALILAGLIFAGQGLGILTEARSPMVGDPRWAVIGAICVVVGVALWVRARRA